MEKMKRSDMETERVKSIDHALRTLNEAAKDSSQEIKSLINQDYRKLKAVLSEVKPEVRGALKELGEVSQESILRAKDQVVDTTKEAVKVVDESVHKNPWTYIGGAAAIGALACFLLRRKD